MRKTLAISILTTIACGLFAWAGNEIKTAVNSSRTNTIKIEYHEKTLDRIENKIDDLYWASIERRGLKPPKKK